MRDRNLIVPYAAIVVLAASISAYLSLRAWGGVDITVYWYEAPFASFSTSRYLYEPISWLWIKMLATNLDRNTFLAGFVVTIIALCIARLGLIGGLMLYVAFFSPFGTLLELNVLRQCLSTIFIAFFILSLSSRQLWTAGIWGICAILCHNSAALLLVAAVAAQFASTMTTNQRVVAGTLGVLVILFLQLFGLLEGALGGSGSGSYNALEDDGVQNIIYVGFAIAYCALIYFFSDLPRWRPIVLGLASATIVATGLVTVFGFGSWVYGRIAISVVVLCQFLFIYEPWIGKFASPTRVLASTTVVTGSALLILLHPGAQAMLSSQGY
ncbi:EpsG family protein [Tsuneonella suprasediminis]|uniref:EpsG family protein n=1 Tax=Tsuneonella suprasediminis TaxID=2306996 RepID=UPI002F9268D8